MPGKTTENPRFVLGLKLRTLRHERKATLQQLAHASGLSISYLSEIEKGRKYPKPEKLLRLAEALEVPFDDLVSLRVDEALDPLKQALTSELVQGFPFELFGLEPEGLFGLVDVDPARAGAFLRTFVEMGQTYDVRVEHFLLAALRSYQQMHSNHFEEIETAAEAFRHAEDLPGGQPVPPERFEEILVERYGYRVDREQLISTPDLSGFRSVFAGGQRPVLYLNPRLLASQQAFVLAREVGYRVLGLGERAISSSWLEVKSFEQVLNNFKASYFSGAVLLDRESLAQKLAAFFRRTKWQPDSLLGIMGDYDSTPETFFTRLSQLVPELHGLGELYFMRFHIPEGTGSFRLTKVLNMSRVPVPHGIGLNEHYCRRWPAIRLLQNLAGDAPNGSAPVALAQRSHFLDEDAEFFVFSMSRPLALAKGGKSSVSLGFLLNDDFKNVMQFWDDPAIPRLDVNLTCERCSLSAEACAARVVPPRIVDQKTAQQRRAAALQRLLDDNG